MGNCMEMRDSYFTSMVAFLVAFLLLLIPWQQLSGHAFSDLLVYQEKFVLGVPLMERMGSFDIGYFFAHEGAWDVFVRYLIDSASLQVGTVFSLITFVTLFTFVRFVVIRSGILAVFFLVNPLVIDLAFSQLRFAFALSLFILAIDTRRFDVKWVLLIFSLFFHTAMALFVGVYLLCLCFIESKKIRVLFRGSAGFFVLFVAFSVFFVVGPLRDIILNALGDRRAGIDAESSSVVYASFWFFYAFITLTLMRGKLIFEPSVLIGVIFVLVFLFVTLFGGYSLRYLSASIPFVISSMFMFFIGGGTGDKMHRVRCFLGMSALGIASKQCILSGLLILLFAINTSILWYYWLL